MLSLPKKPYFVKFFVRFADLPAEISTLIVFAIRSLGDSSVILWLPSGSDSVFGVIMPVLRPST